MNIDVYIGMGITFITAISGLIVAWNTRKKQEAEARREEAEAATKVTDAALSLIIPLQTRLAKVEQELENEIERRRELERGVNILVNQLRKQGIEPEWTPSREKTVPRK